jgi:MFS family permease
MERFSVRKVVMASLTTVGTGALLTIWMSQSWHLMLLWGVVVGVGTGSMALVFAATIANRWFVKKRGLVVGILTAAAASGQLVFLPGLSRLAQDPGWQASSLVIALCAYSDGAADFFLFKRGSTKY